MPDDGSRQVILEVDASGKVTEVSNPDLCHSGHGNRPRWVPVSERLPEKLPLPNVDLGDCPDRRVPFICPHEKGDDETNEAIHFGYYVRDGDLGDDDDKGTSWYCETCELWFGNVTQWFDLPLPEGE